MDKLIKCQTIFYKGLAIFLAVALIVSQNEFVSLAAESAEAETEAVSESAEAETEAVSENAEAETEAAAESAEPEQSENDETEQYAPLESDTDIETAAETEPEDVDYNTGGGYFERRNTGS
ncbi:MAG: hypothetical protein LUE96_10090 [Lachnospiraceae bacterium]|nr:hypothetical protein [Lachnospiraceae bacterium]